MMKPKGIWHGGDRTVHTKEIPKGGRAGDVLIKKSVYDYDLEWTRQRIEGVGSLSGRLTAVNNSLTQAACDIGDLQDNKVDANAPITGNTRTKITYDSKGLITVGAHAGISDITGLQGELDGKLNFKDTLSEHYQARQWSLISGNNNLDASWLDVYKLIGVISAGSGSHSVIILPDPGTIPELARDQGIIFGIFIEDLQDSGDQIDIHSDYFFSGSETILPNVTPQANGDIIYFYVNERSCSYGILSWFGRGNAFDSWKFA